MKGYPKTRYMTAAELQKAGNLSAATLRRLSTLRPQEGGPPGIVRPHGEQGWRLYLRGPALRNWIKKLKLARVRARYKRRLARIRYESGVWTKRGKPRVRGDYEFSRRTWRERDGLHFVDEAATVMLSRQHLINKYSVERLRDIRRSLSPLIEFHKAVEARWGRLVTSGVIKPERPPSYTEEMDQWFDSLKPGSTRRS